MKVLVTGAQGQLGKDVVIHLRSLGHELYTPDREVLDIQDQEAVYAYFRDHEPEAVIHAAAYTLVDQAEEEPDLAFSINAEGTKHVALAAKEVDATMVYISTDYVLSGEGTIPFSEEAVPSPQNVYGESKLRGENYVQEILEKYFIVRISWVFGLHGNNFVKTMLRLGEERDSLSVVDDQVGSPTFTEDLVVFLGALLGAKTYGVYHATNEGFCSWYTFALEIFNQAKLPVQVLPVQSHGYKTKATRPLNSRLSKEKLYQNGFQPLPPWQDALHRFLDALQRQEEEREGL